VSAPDLDAASDSGYLDTDDITSDNLPTLSGTAEPGSTVDLMEGSTVLGTVTADPSGNWSITPTTALSDGVHTLVARATDPSGNAWTSNVLAVSIDTGAPAPDAGADQMRAEGDITALAGTYSDDGGFGPYSRLWHMVSSSNGQSCNQSQTSTTAASTLAIAVDEMSMVVPGGVRCAMFCRSFLGK
jgi:hypothetical protein